MADLLADELVRSINGLRRAIRRRLRAQRDEPALSGSQVELLRVVEATPGIGVAAAARAMHLANNSVSALVYQLVDAGYLRRETDPTDRRAARLYLTPAADGRLGAWRAERGELVGAALAELTAAERSTIARALPTLHRLATILSTMDEDDEVAGVAHD